MADKVTSITIGKRIYECSNTQCDENSANTIDKNGKRYIKTRVKNNGNEEPIFKYILCDGGKEVEEQTTTVKNTEQKDLPFFIGEDSTWNRMCDAIGDGEWADLDTSEKKDDISWGERLKQFGLGMLSPIKEAIKHPLITLGAGAACALACAFIPLAGPVLLGVGLLGGLFSIGHAIYKGKNAKTKDEAKAAWREGGAGTITALLSAVGIKKFSKAGIFRSKIKNPGSATLPQKLSKVKNLDTHALESQASSESGIRDIDTTIQSVKEAFDFSGLKYVKNGSDKWCRYTNGNKPSTILSRILQRCKQPFINNAIKKDLQMTNLSDFKNLAPQEKISKFYTACLDRIRNGNYAEAKRLIAQMKSVVSQLGFKEADLKGIENIIAGLERYNKATKYINTTHGLGITARPIGCWHKYDDANRASDVADEIKKFNDNLYEFA